MTIVRFEKPLSICTTAFILYPQLGHFRGRYWMSTPRRFDMTASDVIDAEFALCRCQCADLSSTKQICLRLAIVIRSALTAMVDTTASAGCKLTYFGEACQGILFVFARRDSRCLASDFQTLRSAK